MRKTILLGIIVLGIMSSSSTAAEYKLVWSDEFEGAQVDENNWRFDVYPGVVSSAQERAYYTDRRANARVSGGYLAIVARREKYEDNAYTSARLNTFGKRSFCHGRIEARIQLPCDEGLRSKLWLLPDELTYGSWGASGEIDVVDARGPSPEILAGIHFGGSGPRTEHAMTSIDRDLASGVCGEFHVFSVEWQPFEMRWFVDDQLVARQNRWFSAAAEYPAPFNSPFYINVGLAVEGDVATASLRTPREMLIDWIRVYQAEGNRAPRVRVTSPDDGAKLATGSIVSIQADASDVDGDLASVEFYANEELIGQVEQPPFVVDWPAPDGCHRLVVRAVDEVGYAYADSVAFEQGQGCPPTPYHGKPGVIPGVIEAEDFDESVKGEAYFDTDPTNNGGAYRPESGVDIQECGEGGANVCWMIGKEWMQYTVFVQENGRYDIRCRVASPMDTARIRIEFDGTDKTGSLAIPRTGDWQRYADVIVRDVALSKGKHIMRVYVEEDGLNLNYVAFTRDH